MAGVPTVGERLIDPWPGPQVLVPADLVAAKSGLALRSYHLVQVNAITGHRPAIALGPRSAAPRSCFRGGGVALGRVEGDPGRHDLVDLVKHVVTEHYAGGGELGL
jgi:hypothetical protein